MWLGALLWLGAGIAHAQTQTEAVAVVPAVDHEETLGELIESLTQHNPLLEQARQAFLAAKLQVPQAGALPGAQFDLLEQANTGGPFDFNRNSGFYAYPTLTQPLPWPGKLRLSAEIAQAQADAVSRQYDALRLQLTGQLKLACYQWLALQDQLHFMDEDRQRLEQVKEVSKVRYANNAAAYVDFLNAQVSAGALDNDRFTLAKQIQQQQEQINSLLGRSSQSPLRLNAAKHTPQLPATSLPDLIALAQKANPVVAAGESQIEAADKGVSLARKGFFPDLAVSVGAYTDPTLIHPERSRLYSIGVNVSLPTWGFRKENAALDQARALLEQARAGQTATLNQVDLGVANAYHGLETALRQVQFIQDRQLPQAQVAYRLGLAGYSANGGTAFVDLLTAQGNLRAAELSLVQAQNSAVQAYISLSAAIGKEPE